MAQLSRYSPLATLAARRRIGLFHEFTAYHELIDSPAISFDRVQYGPFLIDLFLKQSTPRPTTRGHGVDAVTRSPPCSFFVTLAVAALSFVCMVT